jgi:hypothetical protein
MLRALGAEIPRRHAAPNVGIAPLLNNSDVNYGLLLPILLHCASVIVKFREQPTRVGPGALCRRERRYP